MLVVHLSDVHCDGYNFKEEMLVKAIDEINALGPDIVIATGDLTNEGLSAEFECVEKHLGMLKTRQMRVCSGNHDSRSTGYLLFPKYFGETTSVTKFQDTAIITVNSSRPDREDGELGFNQGLWLRDKLSKYNEHFKIVGLHHHVMPVPETGMERNTISDAGDFLHMVITHRVNMVLCGHRHRPWVWRVENLPIINAGAVSTEKLRGFFKNSYNIIEVGENREIKVMLKVVGEPALNMNKILEHLN